MKIALFISNFHHVNLTGQQKIGFNLAENLSKRGLEVVVITNHSSYKKRRIVKYKNFKCLAIPGEANNINFILNMNFIIQYVKKYNPDLIHGHGISSSPMISFIGKILRKPTVHTIFDIRDFNRIYKPLFLVSLLSMNKIICTSCFIKKILSDWGIPTKKMDVIYHGINQEWLDLKISRTKRKKRTILFWGDAKSSRGIDFLIRMIKEKHKEFSKKHKIGYTFAVRYYDPGYKDKLKKLSKEYPVKILGKIDNVVNLVSKSDIIILPYTTTTIQPPLTLVESMSAGKGVITTDVDSNREFVGTDRGILIEPNKMDEINNKLQLLLSKKILLDKISKNAREFIREKYKWASVNDRIIMTYKKVVK